MNHDEAMQHGLGYASGREDASGTPAAIPPGELWRSGWVMFAEAYAQGHDDFNEQRRHDMIPVRDAYANWQDSGGRSVFTRGQLTLSDDQRAELRAAWPGAWHDGSRDHDNAYRAYWTLRDRYQAQAWAALEVTP